MPNTLTSPIFWIPLCAILAFTVGAVFLSQHLQRRHAARLAKADEPKDAKAKASVPGVTFDDLAGMDDPISELQELRQYLAYPHRFDRLGAKLPTGILLYGPPGCGKTLLARALAGETGVPFFYISAASFVERYVGVGAARVRELFATAREQGASIVFIDELDAIGRHRHGNSDGDGGREFDNTLNQLLIELDGEGVSAGVMVIAATNRPEMIDPALLRPGRFDRRVLVDLPSQRDREQILMLHAAKRRFSPRVDWGTVARDVAGASSADLANLVNEASLLAARWHREMIGPEDVDEACGRLHVGTGTSPTLDDGERRLIAYHEAGHALLCLLLRGMKTPPRVSIFSRGNASERSVWSITHGRAVLTKRELQAQLILLLGGRAAELNVFGEPTTRSEDDLEHAGVLARKMVERWAMTDTTQAPSVEALASQMAAGQMPLGPTDGVGRLLAKAEQAARVILNDHADDLERIAEALIYSETLSGSQLEALVSRGLPRGVPARPAEVRPAEVRPAAQPQPVGGGAGVFDHEAPPRSIVPLAGRRKVGEPDLAAALRKSLGA
ncbi:MAG: AAA family ATPase [Acidimicrobiales bacterium]